APTRPTVIPVRRMTLLPALPAIEILLEDDRRRRRIEPLLPRAPVLLADREPAFGLAAGQTLVLKHHRKIGALSKTGGECFDTRCHIARRSIKVAWHADHERLETVLLGGESGHLGRGAVNGIAVESRGLQHTDRTGKRAGRVADGHPDPPLPNV